MKTLSTYCVDCVFENKAMRVAKTDIAPGIFTLSDVLSPEECKACIELSEGLGFETALINMNMGGVQDRDVRNNGRVILDDAERAALLWSRIAPEVPVFLNGRQARGLNERFRFYRYEPGQQFKYHQDGSFERPNGEKSQLTFMVYLNEDFEGGETRFNEVCIAPRTGMALVFRHDLLHEGATVQRGQKYVLRSDVMYGAVGRIYG